jgi:hypothetical protein
MDTDDYRDDMQKHGVRISIALLYPHGRYEPFAPGTGKLSDDDREWLDSPEARRQSEEADDIIAGHRATVKRALWWEEAAYESERELYDQLGLNQDTWALLRLRNAVRLIKAAERKERAAKRSAAKTKTRRRRSADK